MPAKKNVHTFEKDLSKLEAIVQKMEEGTLSLEASLSAFEEGVKLARQCQQTLAAAEQKVRILTESSSADTEDGVNNLTTQPFDVNSTQDKTPRE